jgi:hypothetical protein
VLGAHGPPGGMELTWYYLEPIRKHAEGIDFAHLDAKRAVQRLTKQQVEQGAPQREQQARGGAASAVVHEEDSGAGVFPQRSSAVQQQQQQQQQQHGQHGEEQQEQQQHQQQQQQQRRRRGGSAADGGSGSREAVADSHALPPQSSGRLPMVTWCRRDRSPSPPARTGLGRGRYDRSTAWRWRRRC